jgi:SAM-dependent methyltransferase
MKRIAVSILRNRGYRLVRTEREPKHDDELYRLFPRESLEARKFYNIGAGLFYHKYWTNIDYESEHYSRIQNHPFINFNLMDLSPLPIADSSAEIVYSSHTIEHISDEAASNLFKESWRILKPGGVIRITTPDSWLAMEAYKRNDVNFFYWVERYSRNGSWEHLYKMPLSKASIHQLFLHRFASQLCEIDIDDSPTKKYSDSEIIDLFETNPDESILSFFTSKCKYNSDHPGNHINWWTRRKAISMLKNSGFDNPYVSGWGQSLLAPLRNTDLFDKTHPKISLYIEAIK